jgi:hypothetical protein
MNVGGPHRAIVCECDVFVERTKHPNLHARDHCRSLHRVSTRVTLTGELGRSGNRPPRCTLLLCSLACSHIFAMRFPTMMMPPVALVFHGIDPWATAVLALGAGVSTFCFR